MFALWLALAPMGCDPDPIPKGCDPGPEVCDGADNDCDAAIDEDATDAGVWYPDTNGDGHGDPEVAVTACEAPAGHVATPGGECDEAAPCATSACAPASCVEGVCLAGDIAAAETPCDVDDMCTAVDRCDGAGVCVGSDALICDDPPDVDVAAVCATSSTVGVYLGDGCGSTCDPAAGCVYSGTVFDCPDATAKLPQDDGWEVALRAGLAEWSAEDFDVPLDPFVLDEASVGGPEEWLILSLAFDRSLYYTPTSYYFRVPSEVFTLASIEQADGVHGGGVSIVDSLLFWERWDFPGNPHHGDEGIRRRALVMASVDLMMLDYHHTLGNYAQQHYLSGSMPALAGAYLDGADLLDTCTSAAYRKGLQERFEELEAWDSNNGNNDMAQPGHIGMYEAALAMPDPTWLARAEAESIEIFDGNGYWHDDAGYFDHGVALDSSYEGISIHFLVAAALETPWSHLDEHLAQYVRLKSYLTLPEPDGVSFVSPSHWNPATSGGVTEDQWWTWPREVGTAMVTDEAMYLMGGGRAYNLSYDPTDETAIHAAVLAAYGWINEPSYTYGRFTTAETAWAPGIWAETHWSTGRAAYVLYAEEGFYERLVEAGDTPPPVFRGEDYVENFGDDFVVVRFADYAAIAYAGPIADSWAIDMAGMGGGALSAFWTPEGGSFLLGFTHGSQNPSPDTWDEVEIWPMQHLYGTTPSGGAFSTALVQAPGRSVSTTAEDASVSITGTIGSEAWSAADVLVSSPTYTRDLTFDAAGVSVRTTVTSDGIDEVCSLVDVLPLYQYDLYQADHDAIPTITLVTADGETVAATTEWTPAVAVRVHRFDGDATITLDTERRVRMAPSIWSNNYQNAPRSWSLHLDVLGSDECGPMPALAEVSWSIAPG